MITWALLLCALVAYTGGFRIVCYYSNAAQYRSGVGAFKPEDIDPKLCTHLVYQYAMVDKLTLATTEYNDQSSETIEGMYSKIAKHKKINADLKILLAVGEPNGRAEAFYTAVANHTTQLAFARNVVEYVRNITFDGIHLEWANLAAHSDPRYKKDLFLDLLKEIKAAFNNDSLVNSKPNYILAVSVPAIKHEIETGYDLVQIARLADFISFKAFDMITNKRGKVGLTAPFLPDPRATGNDRYLSFKYAVFYYMSRGIPYSKLNVGIATYGRTFTLRRENETTIGSEAIGYANAAPWSGIVGLLSYYEMCQYIWRGGTVFNVPAQRGRYYVLGNIWITYEDTLSIMQKACFLRNLPLGGITFWTLDLDDFSGYGCREGQYPLIKTFLKIMEARDNTFCYRLNSTEYVASLTERNATDDHPPAETKKLRVVCYYASWAYHRRGKGQCLPEHIDANLCTHIIYAYGIMNSFYYMPMYYDERSEPWRLGLFGRVAKLKNYNPALKVLMAIGSGIGAGLMDRPSTTHEGRRKFASSVTSFLRKTKFDGLDVTWDLPRPDKLSGFMDLMRVLRKTFVEDAAATGKPALLLTVALPAGKGKIDMYGGQILNIEELVDFINLQTYDFHGNWERHTSPSAPLFEASYENDENKMLNVNWVARYYIGLGLKTSKMNIGIPTYGHTYTLADANYIAPYSPTRGEGDFNEFTWVPGLISYYEICDHISNGAEVYDVSMQRVPYAVERDQWMSFEDTRSVSDKACYALNMNFGGVTIWSIDLDDFGGESCNEGRYPLLTAAYNIARAIDMSKCQHFRILKTFSEASRGIHGGHLQYIALMIQTSLLVFYIVHHLTTM